jgi:hypothetical protein
MLALPPPFQLIVGAPGGLPEPKAMGVPPALFMLATNIEPFMVPFPPPFLTKTPFPITKMIPV